MGLAFGGGEGRRDGLMMNGAGDNGGGDGKTTSMLPELPQGYDDVSFMTEEDTPAVSTPGERFSPAKTRPGTVSSEVPPARLSVSVPVTNPIHPLYKPVKDPALADITPGTRQALPQKAQAFIDQLERLSQDPAGVKTHTLVLIRKGPLAWEGETIDCGSLEELSVTSFEHVRNHVIETWGGGDYSLSLKDGVGRVKDNLNFSVSPRLYTPKTRWMNPEQQRYETRPAGRERSNHDGTPRGFNRPLGGNSMFSPTFAGQTPFMSSMSGPPLEGGIVELQKKRALLEAQDGVEDAEASLLAKRRERQRRSESADRMELERQRGGGDEAVKMEMASLKDTITQQQAATVAMIRDVVQGFKDAILPIMSRPAENGVAVMIPLLAEVMKSGSEQTRAMFEALAKRESAPVPPPSNSEGKLFELLLNESHRREGKSDKLLEVILTKQMGSSDDKIQTLLNGIKMGQEQAEKWQEALRQGETGQDSGGWNPEAGAWSNIGNLIFGLLKKFVSGAGPAAAPRPAIEALAELSGRPQGTQQFTDADLHRAAGQILQRQFSGGRPQAPLQLGQGQPVEIALNRPSVEQGSLGTFGGAEPPVAPPVGEAAPAANPFIAAYHNDTGAPPALSRPPLVTPPPPVAPQPPAPSQPPASPLASLAPEARARLVGTVTEMVGIAATDLEDGRAEPDWLEFAAGKLPGYFKAALCQAATPLEQIGLIASFSTADAFERLKILLTAPAHPERHAAFFGQLDRLIGSFQEGLSS